MFEVFLVIVGLATLLGGGDLLLRGATKVAESFGMSRLLIGLTVVSLGTSAPEVAICVDAALHGKAEIALGNIIGSNIANVLLILGITASLIPIVVHRKIIQREVPLMISVSLLFLLLVLDGHLTFSDGLILLFGMAGFLAWQFRSGSTDVESPTPEPDEGAEAVEPRGNFLRYAVLIGLGMSMLWIGAGWLVQGATGIAASFGISELVIGLTIVAIGTSSPEIVTSLIAAKRGYPEMAVGGVIGSNIANLLLVGGTTAVIARDISVPSEAFEFDVPVMIVAAIACLPIFASGHKVSRWEGFLFLACFVSFTVFLFYRDQFSAAFPGWSKLVWPVTLPLILATIYVVVSGWLQERKEGDIAEAAEQAP